MQERLSWLQNFALKQSKYPILSCILSFYVFFNGLHATNLKKIKKNTASALGKNFTGSYIKKCI